MKLSVMYVAVGTAAVWLGVWLIYPPAAIITIGLSAIGVGMLRDNQ